MSARLIGTNKRLIQLAINEAKKDPNFTSKEIDIIQKNFDKLPKKINSKESCLFLKKNNIILNINEKTNSVKIEKAEKYNYTDNGNNDYFHKRIRHPTLPFSYSEDNGEVTVAHFTTTNYYFEKYLTGVKMGDPIPVNILSIWKNNDYNSFQAFNQQFFKGNLGWYMLQNPFLIVRPKGTWYLGENADIPLKAIGTLLNGKTQYVSAVLMAMHIKEFLNYYNIVKIFSNENKPPEDIKINAIRELKKNPKIQQLDILNGNFSEKIVDNKEILDPTIPANFDNNQLTLNNLAKIFNSMIIQRAHHRYVYNNGGKPIFSKDQIIAPTKLQEVESAMTGIPLQKLQGKRTFQKSTKSSKLTKWRNLNQIKAEKDTLNHNDNLNMPNDVTE